VENSWKKFNPNEPFEYSFLDQDFDKNYKAESRLAALVRNFMIIAITICCLGLFGLATFSAEQRTKEIGIRKVLGSSVTGIVGLLSKDFVKLVLIGNLVAIPVAWYIMDKWLQDFAFRTPLNWWVFGAAIDEPGIGIKN
jgi:putative ABC transport system permease protein